MKRFNALYVLTLILLLVSSCSSFDDVKFHLGGDEAQTERSPRPPVENAMTKAIPEPLPNTQTAVEEPAQPIEAKYKIGLLVPLTGRSENVGKSIADAAQMAIYESGSTDFQVLQFDTGDTAAGAGAAAEQAIAAGVNIIVGPVFSDGVGAVASKARAANIKVLSFSNNRAVAGGNVYILGLIPDQQISRIVKYANARGIKGFSAVLPNSVFGNQVAEVMTQQVQLHGTEIRKISLYSAARPDFSTSGKEINEEFKAKSIAPDRKSEAVLIPEGGDKLSAILRGLSGNNISSKNTRILGTSLWDNEKTITSGRLNGAWYTGSPYEDSDAFIGRFINTFNYKPEDIAGIGYDAIMLAVETAPSNFADSELRRARGFKGVRGIYKFDGSKVNQRGYAIYEIRDGAAHVIDASPDHF